MLAKNKEPQAGTPKLPQLMRSFVLSAVQFACNDAKTPYPIVQSRYEVWKKAREDERVKSTAADEKYIVQYANKRAEYERAYLEWSKSRNDIIKSMKETNIVGKQMEFMKQLLELELPEVLTERVDDVYTKHKPNA